MWHRLFQVGLLVKGGHAILDLIGALFIYFTTATTIRRIIGSAVSGELLEDPNDILANYVMASASNLSHSAQEFAALYLFVSGVINLVLVLGILTNMPRAYAVAGLLMTMFIVYQVYLYIHTFSPWVLMLAVYDCVLLILIYLEHQRIERTRTATSHL